MFSTARTFIFTLWWLFSLAIIGMDAGDKNMHSQLIEDDGELVEDVPGVAEAVPLGCG